MRKITFLTGFGAGYVLGSRAGRERYDQIASGVQSVVGNAKVQQTAGKAKEQAVGLAGTAKDKVTGKSDDHKDDAMNPFADDLIVVDMNGQVGTGTGPTGTNDRMGI